MLDRRKHSRNRVLHGLTGTRVYEVWRAMLRRCNDQRSHAWMDYGGRGIRVCERWMDIYKFLSDMGEPPLGMELDRIDVNGNYEPSNCRWASIETQSRNRRSTVLITFLGETKCLAEWGSSLGLSGSAMRKRINAGWPLEKALTTPAVPLGKRGTSTKGAA